MPELEPNDRAMDGLLRQSLAAPVPQLPANFAARVQRDIQGQKAGLGAFPRRLLSAYGVMATVTSAVVMRNQGLGWGAIGLLLLGPVAMAALVARRGRWDKVPGQL